MEPEESQRNLGAELPGAPPPNHQEQPVNVSAVEDRHRSKRLCMLLIAVLLLMVISAGCLTGGEGKGEREGEGEWAGEDMAIPFRSPGRRLDISPGDG